MHPQMVGERSHGTASPSARAIILLLAISMQRDAAVFLIAHTRLAANARDQVLERRRIVKRLSAFLLLSAILLLFSASLRRRLNDGRRQRLKRLRERSTQEGEKATHASRNYRAKAKR
jgi:hypothetical protein